MTLKEKIERRDKLAALIAIHRADNVDRAEYGRLREEIMITEEEMKI